jgi:hypothetical protein
MDKEEAEELREKLDKYDKQQEIKNRIDKLTNKISEERRRLVMEYVKPELRELEEKGG